MSRKRVEYFYDCDIGNYHYGPGHPMRPHRVRMTHNLIVEYGLYKKMNIFRPELVSAADMTRFHSDDYIHFLRQVTPDSMGEYFQQLTRFNIGHDCPVFDGLFDYCRTYTSGSIGGAVRLNNDHADVVVNWSGGMHHAKKSEASGFCYTNDIVLACLELLKKHERVLYIDIDIHHGDGVEEAFYLSNRVMTVSFHQSKDFFPGTGKTDDTGHGDGNGYSINFPLEAGMDDESFLNIFRPIIDQVAQSFVPKAVVMCCGADSIAGDRLGCWNLSIKGHAECIKYVQTKGLPLLVLGGGGYSLRNVARCWTYETAVVLGEDLKDALPFHRYYDYYGPEYRLHTPVSNMQNDNTKAYLEKTTAVLLDTLRGIEAAPGVVISSGQPGTFIAPGDLIDVQAAAGRARDGHDADSRFTAADQGKKPHEAEYGETTGSSRGGALRAHNVGGGVEPSADATEVHPLDDDG